MKKRVTFVVHVPESDDCTPEQIDAWIRFRLGEIHHADVGPLIRYSIDAQDVIIDDVH
jgi:hypothetical protein